MFMGRWGEKELICALRAIDTEFLARTVIRADKGPIDFVIHGILEFLCEIGRKRIIPVKSSQSIGCNEHDHFLVGCMARALRIDIEKRFGDNFPVLHAVYSWILRHSGWQRWYTAFQRYKGRIYNGEVCDLFECVLFKVPSREEAKLDDPFRLGVWIGKTSRGDDHLIFDGDEVRKCRTVKRRPEYLRWDQVRVDAIDAHPQRPRPPRERILRDRPKRYITWVHIKKYGGTPSCKACAFDGSRIFQKEDDEAATSSMNPPTITVAGADPMHVECPRDEAIPTTITGGAASSSAGPVSSRQAQFDVEITEATPKRSELEEMPESRKVRKINGL